MTKQIGINIPLNRKDRLYGFLSQIYHAIFFVLKKRTFHRQEQEAQSGCFSEINWPGIKIIFDGTDW